MATRMTIGYVPETQVLVDGDPIVYRVGFATQSQTVSCVVSCDDGSISYIRFANKTERNEYLQKHPTCGIDSEEIEVKAEPVENALHTVKSVLSQIKEETGSDNLHIILSESFGGGNFRHAIAKQAPYKGNRKAPRPAHYQSIRDYLTEYHGAVVVETREADDEIAIRANRYRQDGVPYAIATIDKDLDQIPGMHYDYAKKVVYNVSNDEARRAFWIQALAGDPTDNIPGCWKVGPVKAAALVDMWIKDGMDDGAIFTLIVAQYERSTELAGCPYRDREPLHVALETAQLVYMQQKPCELWAPPGVPFGRIGCEIDD